MYKCQNPNCSNSIPDERYEFLKRTNNSYLLCINCAAEYVKPVKAIYEGENGTSKMIFSDKVSLQSGIYLDRYKEENLENDLTEQE